MLSTMMKGHNGVVRDKSDTMTNLLDSTDSDVEWLNLPPIKGKKPKKRKASKHRESNWTCCLWPILKVFLLITTVVTLALLSIATVWLSSQLSDLRDRFKIIESRDTVTTDELQRLYLQMASVNKSLEADANTLKHVLANMSQINHNVTKMFKTVDKLNAGLESAPLLKEMPDKLKAVSQTVAAMGSSLSGIEDTNKLVAPFIKLTTSQIETISKDIATLKQASQSASTSSNDELSPEMSNLIQKLPQQIQDMNTTVSTQMDVVMKSLSLFEERFSLLENITKILSKNMSSVLSDHSTISTDHAAMTGDTTSDHVTNNMTSVQFKASVTEIVQSMLSNIRNNSTSGETTTTTSEGTLQKLQTDMQGLNTSMVNLKSDVQQLSGQLVSQTNQVVTLTHMSKATQNYITRLEADLRSKLPGEKLPELTTPALSSPVSGNNSTDKPALTTPNPPILETQPVPQTVAPTTQADKPTTVPDVNNNTVTDNNKAGGTTDTVDTAPPVIDKTTLPVEKNKTTQESTTVMSHTPAISIPGINNEDDLELHFSRWNTKGGSGKVDLDEVRGFQGHNTPTEEDMKPFDEDNDGLYTKQEFAKALGITLGSSDDIVTDVTVPPR